MSCSQELSPDVVAAAQARGRVRDLEATVAELLAELGEQEVVFAFIRSWTGRHHDPDD